MIRRFAPCLISCSLLLLLPLAVTASDRSVTASDVNGTWRAGQNEIEILALGHGKLKVQMELIYEYKSPAGPTANDGEASGEATIENDVAVFLPEGMSNCKITMTFLPNGKLKVERQGDDCGFGMNVRADGTYRRVSKAKPKFENA